MENTDIIKVDLNSIKSNMVLALDVVTEEGLVLLARDTMLNNINYTKLRANDIEHVFVKSQSINSVQPNIPNEIHTLEKQKVPIAEKLEYKEFLQEYESKTLEVKKYIHAISDGATIDLVELSNLTSDIMNKLKCKSDIFTFIGFIKSVSEHTYTHSNNVALLCNLFGSWLGLDQNEMMYLTAAGLLHDIGKTKTPPEILNKRGRLTDEEFLEMKKHPVQGYRLLQNQNIPEEIKLAALMHHEKIDGSGYPLGAKSEQINKMSKIVCICDIYDAMTANRIYRGKICPFEVIRTFETKVYGELDTEYLLVFLRNIAYTYIGTWVTLSDGRDAEVMFINQGNLSRPIVRINDDNIIDLMYTRDLSIVSLI